MQLTPTALVCDVCGARVTTLRRGRCWICYIRWADSRPVGLGASCAVCGDRRRDNLRLVEFQENWIPMCHTCGTRAMQLSPTPHTVEGLRQRLSRDRRWQERRQERPDTRIAPLERRRGERRAAFSGGEPWEDASDLIIEVLEACLDEGENTGGANGEDQPYAELTCIAVQPAEEGPPG